MKANKARAKKAVSGKDAGYNGPEDGDNKRAVASSKAGNGNVRAISVKARPGKFKHCIAVKAMVKDKVMDSSEWMKVPCVPIHAITRAPTFVQRTQR